MQASTARSRVVFAVTAMLVVVSVVVPSGQRRRDAEANPTLPLATDTITANPDIYYGKQVTISAGVEEVLSKTAFTIDQRRLAQGGQQIKSVGKPILVIAPTLNGALDSKNYMLFVGELVKFDPAVIGQKAKDYNIDLSPDVVAKYQGRPALLAKAVIDSHYVDVAKRPLTAEELALSGIMRRVSPAFAALRKGADGANARMVTDSAAVLKQAFSETEMFWRQREDAKQWVHDATEHVAAIERDAEAGKWEAVKASADNLNKVCQTCHGTYRERLDDGTFRIKSGE
ncbi:MAG TPA: hypothetical protein VEK56_17825 [Vicinamibacterales bacterium]|nr:hypothetical protein [Vicinamibacterales bacterium]